VPKRQRYKVRWTHAACQDLESIVEFIARDNISIAIGVLNKVRKTASKLETLPERGRIVPELAVVGLRIYREMICPPWRIIYRISDPGVFVMAVIDSRRNVEDILLERLTR
jgi:plasmid stabilization system protein ParE